jgi:hypothetical protein
MNGDLIACARYHIYDLRVKADEEQITHVLFIIHLSHQVVNSSLLGFQGSPWISSHIDDLRPSTVSVQEAVGLTISEFFLGKKNSQENRTGEHGASGHNIAEIGTVEKGFPRMDAESKDAEQDEMIETEGTSSREVSTPLQVDINRENEGESQLPGCKDDAQITVEDQYNGGVQPMPTGYAIKSSQDYVATQPSITMPNKSLLFRHLCGCIHATASRINDFNVQRSTKRVEILVHLMPKELPREIGRCSLSVSVC